MRALHAKPLHQAAHMHVNPSSKLLAPAALVAGRAAPQHDSHTLALVRLAPSSWRSFRAQTPPGTATRAGVLVDVEVEGEDAQPQAAPAPAAAFELACPICHQTHFSLDSMPSRQAGLACFRCQRTFSADERYVDLTLTSGVQQQAYKQKAWGGTEIFRSPLVSFVYERGWRQGFAWAGFPGVDKEYDLASVFLQPACGRPLVDMSCGSGLFARRFAKSGQFSSVTAADFSESMLGQAKAYFEEDGTLDRGTTPVLFLRADVGRLPFATGSVAAMHAGAALHCWPNPQAALAEISRVLSPGGVFVASTFMVPSAPLGQLVGRDDIGAPLDQLDSQIMSGRAPYKWWSEGELRDLCASVGLQDFQRERSWRFIMFAVRKPGQLPPL